VAEIDRRRTLLEQLQGQRADLESQLDTVNAEIEQLGTIESVDQQPRPRGGSVNGRGRRGNKESLSALLHSILRGKTMSVVEMAEAAKKTGYKSKSKNFRAVVSLALLKNRRMFKRMGRGQYTAK
jgi:hypothetical protein